MFSPIVPRLVVNGGPDSGLFVLVRILDYDYHDISYTFFCNCFSSFFCFILFDSADLDTRLVDIVTRRI